MVSTADRNEVVSVFDSSRYPAGQSLQDAWLGIYQTLLWYERVVPGKRARLLRDVSNAANFPGASQEVIDAAAKVSAYLNEESKLVLHIREANDLEKPYWQTRAAKAEAFIADALGIRPEELPDHVDRMMQLDRWRGMQRNNPLGNGLRILVAHSLRRWGSTNLGYEEEKDANTWFPGINLQGRSDRPAMDVAVSNGGIPVAVVSCKWSIRHDRVSESTNECSAYRGAALTRGIPDLRYYVVTNELDGQRLGKILNQGCVTALVHVHLELVNEVGGHTDEMEAGVASGRLLDFSDWVAQSHTW